MQLVLFAKIRYIFSLPPTSMLKMAKYECYYDNKSLQACTEQDYKQQQI